jgi:hypothetical protein
LNKKGYVRSRAEAAVGAAAFSEGEVFKFAISLIPNDGSTEFKRLF